MVDFDFDGIFGEDYLYFYEDVLPSERSDRDTDMIVRLGEPPEGARILDLACGHGRIANRLAARGHEVTGLDSSHLFLEHARRDAVTRGVAVDYVQGDMRAVPWEAEFDLVVNWFTAFGYFDDADNRVVLAGIRRALRPGGRALIETQHRDNIVRRLVPWSLARRGDDIMVDENRFDAQTGRTVSERIVVRDGRVRRAPYSVRVFSFTELRDWMLAAGFGSVDGFGEDGEPITLEHRRLIARATV